MSCWRSDCARSVLAAAQCQSGPVAELFGVTAQVTYSILHSVLFSWNADVIQLQIEDKVCREKQCLLAGQLDETQVW